MLISEQVAGQQIETCYLQQVF